MKLRPILAALAALLIAVFAAQGAAAQVQFFDGSVETDESAYAIEIGRAGSIGVQLGGSWTGTVAFEATIDGTNWVSIDALPSTGAPATTATGPGAWTVITSGYFKFRVRVDSVLSAEAPVRFLFTDWTATARPVSATSGGTTDATIVGPLEGGRVAVALASGSTFSVVPTTSGGLSFSRFVSAASTNATNLKASAGQLYWLDYNSLDATPVYLHLYNTAGTPTCNASILATIPLPSNATAANMASKVINIPYGLAFATGIGYCVTTAADGTGSVSANEVIITFGYK